MLELLAESTSILRKYICVRHQNDAFFKLPVFLDVWSKGKSESKLKSLIKVMFFLLWFC